MVGKDSCCSENPGRVTGYLVLMALGSGMGEKEQVIRDMLEVGTWKDHLIVSPKRVARSMGLDEE